MANHQHIVDKIKWLLTQPGMTPARLVEATGSSGVSTVSEWKRTGRISKEKLLRIAELSGLRVDWWMDPGASVPPRTVDRDSPRAVEAVAGIGAPTQAAPITPSDIAVIGLGQDARAALTPRRRKIMESLMQLTEQQESAVLAMVTSMLPPETPDAATPKLSRRTKERAT